MLYMQSKFAHPPPLSHLLYKELDVFYLSQWSCVSVKKLNNFFIVRVQFLT